MLARQIHHPEVVDAGEQLETLLLLQGEFLLKGDDLGVDIQKLSDLVAHVLGVGLRLQAFVALLDERDEGIVLRHAGGADVAVQPLHPDAVVETDRLLHADADSRLRRLLSHIAVPFVSKGSGSAMMGNKPSFRFRSDRARP